MKPKLPWARPWLTIHFGGIQIQILPWMVQPKRIKADCAKRERRPPVLSKNIS